ncbi:hypothetical protein KQY27_04025 [Methanobrevibacter sp. TMH8]|uniref:hypothetical protein n=1 Tax=Methanobrevibacter sp. TMH8 TaxID=2848611 RepID=UPI001CCE16EB|nr:hypothetical protein [Methanobrevibacter sp. TMH8]MBZ9570713.1 hypothetical protein [Methanobrevibacter sp. TMH8]
MSSRNNDGKIVIALIITLIAFGLGSGIGITVGMSGDDLNSSETHHPVNTTVDVTHNMSQDNPNYGMDVNSYNEYSDNNSSEDSSSGVYYSQEDLKKKSDQNKSIAID